MRTKRSRSDNSTKKIRTSNMKRCPFSGSIDSSSLNVSSKKLLTGNIKSPSSRAANSHLRVSFCLFSWSLSCSSPMCSLWSTCSSYSNIYWVELRPNFLSDLFWWFQLHLPSNTCSLWWIWPPTHPRRLSQGSLEVTHILCLTGKISNTRI